MYVYHSLAFLIDRTLTRNIRERRGEKVAINVPSKFLNEVFRPIIVCLSVSLSFPLSLSPSLPPCLSLLVFKDVHTPAPFCEQFPTDTDGRGSIRALPDHIYMDCMGFGMGCSCLQVTGVM